MSKRPVTVRDFKVRAMQARAWASRWAATAKTANGYSIFDAQDWASEWSARAELAEAYAKRASKAEGRS